LDEEEEKVQTTNREGGESHSSKHNLEIVGSNPASTIREFVRRDPKGFTKDKSPLRNN